MSNMEQIKQYIENNIELIDANKWNEFFQNAPARVSSALLEAEIEFLKYMSAIRTSMFQDCDKLTSFDIPNNILEINSYAFADCQNLKILHLGDNIKSIGHNAFAWCIRLKDINIPNKVEYISERAFFHCALLPEIIISDSVHSIGKYAFYNCGSLKNITLSNHIKNIGEATFQGCLNLENVYINDIANWCSINFHDIFSNPLNYGANLYLNNKMVTDLIIPSQVNSISNYAFFGCKSIKELKIPRSVTYIGERTFADIPNTLEIHYEGTKSELKRIYKPMSFEHTYFTVHCSDGDIIKRKR